MRSSTTKSRRQLVRRPVFLAAVEALEGRRLLNAAIHVINTNDTGAGSLRAALAQAQTDAGDDLIVFDLNGTITLASGELVVDSNVNIQGNGELNTIIDANATSRVFNVQNFSVQMSGLTVKGGEANLDTGAGILNAGSLDLTQVTVDSNGTNLGGATGGGIYNASGATLTLTNCTVSNNEADDGAGIYDAGGTVTLFTSTIKDNTAALGGTGGGIATNGGSIIAGNTNITGNDSGGTGGGVYNTTGTIDLTNCTIDGNTAVDAGGGVLNDGTGGISKSTISGNSATDVASVGGGINQAGGVLTLINCTIAGGNDANQGGGVNVAGGTATLYNVTDSGNSAGTSGGGIRQASGTVTIKNTIVSGNTSTTGPDVEGTFTNSTFNLIGKVDGSSGMTNNVNGNKAGSIAVPLDPQLGALTFNGGPTKTMSIPTTSPAFNAGSNANVPAGVTTDQRSKNRFVNTITDIGAYENQTVVGQSSFPAGPFSITTSGTSTLQAENFDDGGEGVSWHDTTPGNAGGAYRSGVDPDIQTLVGDPTGGSYYIGQTKTGEWLEYTANIATAGTYTLGFRVASNGNGGNFHLEVDGIDKTGLITIPNTGGWHTWTTLTKTGVSLPSGAHVLRLFEDTAGATGSVGNFNYLTFLRTTGGATSTVNTSTASYVRDGSSTNTNFGNDVQLQVKKSSSGFNRETYIKFDLTSLTTISNATLRLFGNNQDTVSATVQAAVWATSFAGSQSWTETGITFTNKPTTPTSVTTFNVTGTTPTQYNVNVTAFLQARKAAGDTQVTFVIKSNTNTSTLTSFNSDEAASNRPQLIVTA